MKIFSRDYDLPANKIKGFEKLDPEQAETIENCKLTRQIVVLDESRYIINEDGNPEMTKEAQKEYDDFVSKVRQEFTRDDIRIIDEGYGVDEDELEWHITGCVMDTEDKDYILGIMEIDICARTEDPDEG